MQFLWSQATWWNANSINAMNALSGMMGMLFASSFLAMRRTMPRLFILDPPAGVVLWALSFVGS